MSSHSGDNNDRPKRTPEMDWGWSSTPVATRTIQGFDWGKEADDAELQRALAQFSNHPVITGIQRKPGESDKDLRARVKQAMFGLAYGAPTGRYTWGKPVTGRLSSNRPNLQGLPGRQKANWSIQSAAADIHAKYNSKPQQAVMSPDTYEAFEKELLKRTGAQSISPAMEAVCRATYDKAVSHAQEMERVLKEFELSGITVDPTEYKRFTQAEFIPPEEYDLHAHQHPDEDQDPLIAAKAKYRQERQRQLEEAFSIPANAVTSAKLESAQALKEFNELNKNRMSFKPGKNTVRIIPPPEDPSPATRKRKPSPQEEARLKAIKRAIEEGTDW